MKPVILVEYAGEDYEIEPHFLLDTIVYTDAPQLYARYLELVDQYGSRGDDNQLLTVRELEEAITNEAVGGIVWLGVQGISFGMDSGRSPIGCKIVELRGL